MSSAASDIVRLFEPHSVAVIGASHDTRKIGYKVVQNISVGGYTGKVYPVNPQGGEILGHPVYATAEDIPGEVDIACITVPAKFALEAVESCGRKGVKYLLIITSGFSEVGNLELELQIGAMAKRYGCRIMGPNMFGIYSAQVSLNATFGPPEINPGGVAIITQSGALGLAMIGKTFVENIGLSTICSIGNKLDIDEADLMEYLIDHEMTKAIFMYIEGVKHGEKFIAALKRATRKKPVIVLKSGRSARGAQAAASHTGSLAGSDAVFEAIMKQCGVLRAEDVKDAFEWCKYLSNNPIPSGDRAVIVTNGGGIGVMTTDACEKYDVSLFEDEATLREVFAPVTPEIGSLKNPIDLTGGATAVDYEQSLRAAADCGAIGTAIALYCETALFNIEQLSGMVRRVYEHFSAKNKNVVFALFGGAMIKDCLESLAKERIPVYGSVYDSVAALGAAYAYRRYIAEQPSDPVPAAFDVEAINAVVAKARSEGRYFLLTHEAQEIMRIAGVPIPRTIIARNLRETVQAAKEIGYPVVMKVVSKDIIHKSDAGGVAINLLNESEVIDAFEAIMRNCRLNVPRALIEGVEVAEMVKKGTEIIAGAKIDPSFGPIVMAGLGGIYVEVMKDVAFRAYPLDRREIFSMIREVRSYRLLMGVRGEKAKDIESLVETIAKLGAIVQKCRGISDIEINPVMVYEAGRGAKAVDTRILLSQDTER